MLMYVKLFSSIYQGTLRGNAHGLLVFTNLLAHADEEGVVDIHPKAIAEEVGLSHEEVKASLLMLESPDPESRSPEDEGRRISRIDEHRSWGWKITNHAKYAAIRKAEDRKAQVREAVKRHRERKNVIIGNHEKSPESARNQKTARKAHQDIDQDKDINTHCGFVEKETSQEANTAIGGQSDDETGDKAGELKPDPAIAEEIYKAYPRHEAKTKAIPAIERAMAMIPAARLLALTRSYAGTKRGIEKRYIPFAEKWFDEERYLDAPEPAEKTNEDLNAALTEGRELVAAGTVYGDLMSTLIDRYGHDTANRAARHAGWKR